MSTKKKSVQDFWDEASCGEDLYLHGFTKEDYLNHSKMRYELEPETIDFAEFPRFKGLKTLEIGVGLGADHQQLAEAGAILNGVDLTERAINHTKRRFELMGLKSNLQQGDAENLPFEDETFEAVYCFGVAHHSPDTQQVINEIYRVLKPGGFAKIMIYHKYSLVGYMLWFRYAFLTLKWGTSLKQIYDKYLESPGTKAYSKKEAAELFSKFNIKYIRSMQSHGDLLTSAAGQRHKGIFLTIARAIWPRWFFKTFMKNHGLTLFVEVEK